MDWKRLGFYLAINAVVSAVVATGAFLLLRRFVPPAGGSAPTPLPATTSETPAPTGPTSLVPPVDLEHLPTVTPVVYVVQPGDTLGAIAQQFDVSVEDLMAANDLVDPDVLDVGQTLAIPIGGVAPTPAPTLPPTPDPGPVAPFPTATPDPGAPAPRLVIQQVIAPGDLENEAVRLTNLGGAVDLVGWVLEDVEGNRYVFPPLTLYQNGAVTVHTKAGTNSVIDLYWGAPAAVWQVDEILTLRRPDGAVHTTDVVQ